MLRARPKEKKSHFDRFIVLGDADPKEVEERLGNALISNEVIEKLKNSEAETNGYQLDDFQNEKFNYVGKNSKRAININKKKHGTSAETSFSVMQGDQARSKSP